MIARIGKTFTFDAAHQLPNHDGKCARPHGHTYAVTLEVQGEVEETKDAPDEGMVLDYARFKTAWAKLEPLLDHVDLNKTIGIRGCWPTTAENIAGWIMQELIKQGFPIAAVTVRETPGTFARVVNNRQEQMTL